MPPPGRSISTPSGVAPWLGGRSYWSSRRSIESSRQQIEALRLIATGTGLPHSSTPTVTDAPVIVASCWFGCRHPIRPPPQSHHCRTDQAAAAPIRHHRSCSPQHRPQRRRCCLSACGISGCASVLGSLREAFNLVLLSFCFTWSLIGIASPCRPSTSERWPLWRMRLLLCALQIATATLVVKSSSMLPPPRSCHRHLYLATTQLGLPPTSTTSTTMTTSTSATSASKGYHLHVVLAGFYFSHSIRTITTLPLLGMSVCRILPSTYSPVSPSVVLPLWLQGDVRVYLVGYIFCIIDCHICRDIFGRIDIMYYRLPYISRGVLSLRTLVFYIYQPRGIMQYNQ
jgi:hypothetical protein